MAKFVPMVDASLVLQESTTKLAAFDGASCDLGKRFRPRGLGVLLGAVVDVTAAKTSAGNEAYAFNLQESRDGLTWADIGVPVAATGPGVVVAKGIATERFVRLVLNAGGTAPSITYAASVGIN